MPKRRMDARDTIDSAIAHLLTLQSEGWCMSSLETVVGYGNSDKKSVALPTTATLIIKLRPI